MVAAEAHGNQMNAIKIYQERHFTPIVTGFSLSRPWLVLARLCLLLRSTSLCGALRASLRLFKFAPGEFVTQVVATATTLFGASLRLTPSGLTRKFVPFEFFAPELRSDAPARRQDPRSTMNKAG